MKLKRVCYLLSGCLLVLCAFAGSVSAQTLCPFPNQPEPAPWRDPTIPPLSCFPIENNLSICTYNPDPLVDDETSYNCAGPDGRLPLPPSFVVPTNLCSNSVDTAVAATTASGCSTSTPNTNTVNTIKSQGSAAPVTVKPAVTAPPPKCTVTSVPSTTPTQKTYSVTTNAALVKPASKSTAAPSVVTQPSQPKNCDEVTSIDMMF